MHLISNVLCPVGLELSTQDPCMTTTILNNLDTRKHVYEIDPHVENPICDKYAMDYPGQWFRSVDGNELVQNETLPYRCGTENGIWMQGMQTYFKQINKSNYTNF